VRVHAVGDPLVRVADDLGAELPAHALLVERCGRVVAPDGVTVLTPGEDNSAAWGVAYNMLAEHLIDDTKDGVGFTMALHNHVVLLAVRHGECVGYMVLDDRDRDGKYETIFVVWVDPEHRRGGVAKELLQTATRRFPIKRVAEPITPAERAGLQKYAPQLLRA
jgi:ribosomal protein S18 acetylase RimI-like enzyme